MTITFHSDRSELPSERDRGSTAEGSSTSSRSSGGRVSPDNLIGKYTYSGADIKLVVHLPPESEEAAGRTLEEARSEFEEVVREIQTASSSRNEEAQAEARLQELREDEAALLRQIETATWGHETDELEEDIAAVREDILDVLQLIAVIGSSSSIDELEERRDELTREIEALEDEDQSTPSSRTKTLAEIQTLSVTSHREKYPARPLGTTYPRSFCRGPRCIPATEKVLTKDKGYISIANVRPGDYVQSTGSEYNKVVDSFYQGFKPCVSVRVENGYQLIASEDHPVSTSKGWKEAGNLEPGDLVKVACSSPVHDDDFPITDCELKLIAYLIGDGSLHRYEQKDKPGSFEHRIGLTVADNELDTIGLDSARCLDRLQIAYRDQRSHGSKCIDRRISPCIKSFGVTDWHQRKYNSLHTNLLELELYDTYSHTKFIPQQFMSGLSRRQIVLFLRHLFSTDGCYSVSKDLKYIEAQYCSISETLIDQIRILLSKVGISALKSRQQKVGKIGGRKNIVSRYDAYKLVISNAFELVRFVKTVGIFGKDKRIERHLPLLVSRIKDKKVFSDSLNNRKKFNEIVKEAAKRQNINTRDVFTKYNLYNLFLKLTVRRVVAISRFLGDENFSNQVDEEISRLFNTYDEFCFRKVRSVTPVGSLQVYDLEVENRHAFVCNFILVHNTIGGSMVFATFDQHVFTEFLQSASFRSTGVGDWDRYRWRPFITDQIPPLDISIVFANEYGNLSWMGIFGVEFINEGMVMSIEDLFIETTMQYVARDYDPIRAAGNRPLTRSSGVGQSLNGTNLLMRELSQRVAGRRNPFL